VLRKQGPGAAQLMPASSLPRSAADVAKGVSSVGTPTEDCDAAKERIQVVFTITIRAGIDSLLPATTNVHSNAWSFRETKFCGQNQLYENRNDVHSIGALSFILLIRRCVPYRSGHSNEVSQMSSGYWILKGSTNF
jgi:hypothetical protein